MTGQVCPDTCPRCGRAFRCGIDDPAPCPCTAVRLGVERLAAIRASFDDCLCVACLASIASDAPPAGPAI